ncbi:IS66 family transposase [Ensifer sp. LC163]|uniref:IS66 family transposase n=1 Tax=Ensifer sp. LC163 TaxID=1120652 RepID=UPI0039B74DC0
MFPVFFHKRARAQHFLPECLGFLYADAHAGFDKLYESNVITGKMCLTQVACWAYARRDLVTNSFGTAHRQPKGHWV